MGGLYGTYHLLREPETTIDLILNVMFRSLWLWRVDVLSYILMVLMYPGSPTTIFYKFSNKSLSVYHHLNGTSMFKKLVDLQGVYINNT